MEEVSELGLVSPMREPEVMNLAILAMQFGGDTKSNVKALRKHYRAVVSEVYSPPRVAAAAATLSKLDIDPGLSLDITTCDEFGNPWDFSKHSMRKKARERLERQAPELLVGSPMCTAYSTWQRVNRARDYVSYKRKTKEARQHLEFFCDLYAMQLRAGRLLLHEHPAHASSWEESCILRMMRQRGVECVVMDQCQFGQTDVDGNPVKKPTRWMSNCPRILRNLERKCESTSGICSANGMRHVTCNGVTAKQAAIYPFAMCEAIFRGLREHLDEQGRCMPGINAAMPLQGDWDEENPETSPEGEEFYDATTGQLLDPVLVRKARMEEMKYFADKDVWTKRPRREAFEYMGKRPITVKWVDVNKGDDENPNYRSRLVALEIRRKGEASIFAPTPPLEALRTVLSLTATKEFWPDEVWHARPESERRLQISLIDISRAYFNARTKDEEPVYVELPKEDPDCTKGLVGRLNVHMYGSRRAADGWHCEYSDALEELGFERGTSSACVFRHPTKNLISSVHGDDFTTAGPKASLDWFKKKLEERYELKEASRLGFGTRDHKEGRVLNRVVRWSEKGLLMRPTPDSTRSSFKNLD